MIGVVFNCCGEKCVDKGCLAQSRFTSDLKGIRKLAELNSAPDAYHNRESSASLCDDFVTLISVSYLDRLIELWHVPGLADLRFR